MSEKKTITLADIRALPEMQICIQKEDDCLRSIGYTEHCFQHVTIVLERASSILKMLDYPERTIELARIAEYMHDIGNIVNRHDHAHSSAIMAFYMLRDWGMPPEEIADVICAIGNHDEATGLPINPIAAAIIIGDKTDVRSNRVRMPRLRENDIHDRVNGAVENAVFTLDHDTRTVTLSLTIDTEQCPVLEYFEIFLGRMQMCQRAAKYLQCRFKLVINDGLMLG